MHMLIILMDCPHSVNKLNYRTSSAGFSIHKEECTKCYKKVADTIYVCLKCFNGSCHDHAVQHVALQQHPLALSIQKICKNPTATFDPVKITKLAIGKPGGIDFQAEEYETITKLICLQCNKEVKPSNDTQQLVTQILNAHTVSEQFTLKEWEAELIECKHCKDLKQVDIHPLPKENIKCGGCELNTNLWLCLTCGSLGCGRKLANNSGGNGHGEAHFKTTGHPLVCKLGTITSDGNASCYCYACDNDVIDKALQKHLEAFGIDVSKQVKTEKTIGELTLALNLALDLSRTYEIDKQMILKFGKEFTGIENTGNTCYIAAVIQMLFSIDEFRKRYTIELDGHYSGCSRLPADCFFCQAVKLFKGMDSGEYSQKKIQKKVEYEGQTEEEKKKDVFYQDGVNVNMFKRVVGKGHPDFSTSKQQDACEYLMHCLNFIQKAEKSIGGVDCSKIFQYKNRTKLMCMGCHGTKYNEGSESSLALPIILPDMCEVNAKIKVPFKVCLDALNQKIAVSLNCPVCKKESTFLKETKFLSFPDYLIVIAERFVMRDGMAKKIVALLEVPETAVQLEFLRAPDKENGEVMLPDVDTFMYNSETLDTMLAMGIPENHAKIVLKETNNANAEAAITWYYNHINDPKLNKPSQPTEIKVSQENIQNLQTMGFNETQAVNALKKCDNNVERAIEYLFSHNEEEKKVDVKLEKDTLPAAYQLHGFITHLGASASCGHYVAHVRKNGEWIYFNDQKVAETKTPAIAEGFIYIFKRIK